MNIAVIGPTNVDKMIEYMGGSREAFFGKGVAVGSIIAEYGHALWINGDRGMLEAVVDGYKLAGGSELVVVVPERPYPEQWPIDHTEVHTRRADRVLKVSSWYEANHAMVHGDVDVTVCVGLSLGTIGELVYMGMDHRFHAVSPESLIIIQELMRSGTLTFLPEIEVELENYIRYVSRVEDLRDIMKRLRYVEQERIKIREQTEEENGDSG